MEDPEVREMALDYIRHPTDEKRTELTAILNRPLTRKQASWILSATSLYGHDLVRCLFCGLWMEGGTPTLRDHFKKHGRVL